jgi:hypothetical protein
VKKGTLTHIYEESRDQAIGVLRCWGNRDAVFTMEPGFNDENPRVPNGTYLAKAITSGKFGDCWTLIGATVSDQFEPWAERNLIRIHAGNDDDDSLGCIMPGTSLTWDFEDQEPQVSGSRDAMKKLESWFGREDFILEIMSDELEDMA